MTPTEQFYRRLLDLSSVGNVEPLIDDALQLLVELTTATRAYVELYSDKDSTLTPRYCRMYEHSRRALEAIGAAISRGIIERALLEGRTVSSCAALTDERFRDLGSVKRNEIQAVLCSPIGREPPVGAIYLEAPAGRSFSAIDIERIEILARQLAPTAERLVDSAHSTMTLADEIRRLQERRVREALQRHDWNVSAAARELNVGRALVYDVMRRFK